VTDSVWALMGDGQVVMLPRGVDEYLERRSRTARSAIDAGGASAGPSGGSAAGSSGSTSELNPAEQRELRKTMERLERQIAKIDKQVSALEAQMVEAASDHERLAALDAELRAANTVKEQREEEWLEVAERLG